MIFLTFIVKNGTKSVNKGTNYMNNNKKAPEGTISRLYVYLRELTYLLSLNIKKISSSELGDRTNFSDAQVRKDLGYFGNFGVSGAGYDIQELKNALIKILGKDKTWNVAVVGIGYLGSALLAYPGFKEHNLNLVAAFDSDNKKVGKKINEVIVKSIDDLPKIVKSEKISIGIIAVPAESAQEVSKILISAGVECILNFAPASLNVPDNVKVKNVDLSRELETLSYFLTEKTNRK
jgi:redox-sensing transcriptional repressor